MTDIGKSLFGFREYQDITNDPHLLDKIWQHLSSLSPLRPYDKLDQNKKDMRVDSKTFSHDPPPHGVFNRLLEKCDEHYDGNTSKYLIHYHVGMKMGRTTIEAPSAKCTARFLFNIGNAEVYFMEAVEDDIGFNMADIVAQKSKTENIPKDRQIYLPANTFLHLGPKHLANYVIKVKSPPPEMLPTTVSQGDMRPVAGKRFLRPNKYHRITVVIDIIDETVDTSNISKVVNKELNKMNMRDMTKLATTVGVGGGSEEVNLGPLGKKQKKKIKREMKNAPTSSTAEAIKEELPAPPVYQSEEDRLKALMSGNKKENEGGSNSKSTEFASPQI